MLVSPRPPSFLLTYSRLTSLDIWKLPCIDICFLVSMSRSLISFLVHSKTPIVGVSTGTANVLCAWTLLMLFSFELQIFLTLFLYSDVNLFLLSGPSYPMLSSIPRYL